MKKESKQSQSEQIPLTGKRFTFFFDPDQLPLELYEQ